MEKLTTFEISLFRPLHVYHGGETVEGEVTIELSKAIEIKGIKVTYKGEATVHWSEKVTTGEERTLKDSEHSNSEKYFDEQVNLLADQKSSHAYKLEAGRHTYPLFYQLPDRLPSSFEDPFGSVRYIVCCVIERPWKDSFKAWHPFTVINNLDLNARPNCMQPQQATKWKQLCCLCCKSGSIEATLHVDRQGYVPGEAIKLHAHIINGSNRKIRKSTIELIMKKTFQTRTSTKTEHTRVAHSTHTSIEKHSEDIWKDEALTIPPLPPSFLTECSIIDVNYVLQLSIEPSGLATKLTIPLEIIIGSVPLTYTMQDSTDAPSSACTNQIAEPTEVDLALLADDQSRSVKPDALLYRESTYGPVAICDLSNNHNRGQKQYRPMYPYYSLDKTAIQPHVSLL
ncbi:arrestin domain-containing protein 3-like [Physella acuta]|uniref:arrestin domain-containing protein 3-like n=1 Tax=Physella acuta TaxID=109671 RepID=UPI0027DE1E57|nr:arrestin domain-containing protein 3-like [Physella acuta]